MTPYSYAAENGQRFFDQLIDFVKIPSVSTDPARKADTRRAAEWLAADMRRVGLNNVEVMDTPGHPVVYGEWLNAGADAKTVLVYGHYDVQPAVMADGWTHEPFDPIIRDGKLYARGSSDDKGQAFAQIKAFESLLAAGKPNVNVKYLIEGEEEIGSPNLAPFVHQHRDKLKADCCVLSDTGIRAVDIPAMCYSTRGLMYLEMEIQGPKKDLHSGGFGGIVHNPAQALAEIIAQLHAPNGQVTVPGFYDDVLPLSDEERETLRQSATPEEDYQDATGLSQFWGEEGYTLDERIGARPTLEINGFVSGFYGAGSKTVLPAKALAKMSCRLVANQEPNKVFEQVRDYLLKLTPPTVKAEVRLLAAASPALMDLKSPYMLAADKAYEQVWNKKPLYERGGGTLPILADFQRELDGLPIILLGFGLMTDGAHGPDESFTIELFHKGIATSAHFLENVGAMGA